jgi:hypothetical protein
MNNFIITKLDGTTFDLYDKNIPSTILSGSQNCQLLSEDTLTIQTKSAQPLPLSIGDRCTIYGKKYKINTQPSVKKQGPRKFITDVVFEGVQYELLDAQFLLPENTIGDSFTGNLYDFMKILIENANRVGIWSLGNYPENTEYKTLTFSGENCLSVLQRLCEEYNNEFEIEQTGGTNTLHIRTAGVDFPYTFRYGSTGGLYELTRKNINSENVVTRLYAYGGSNNLGNGYLSARGCGKLCLPGKSKNGSFIQNQSAIQNYGLKENIKIFDTIFPNRYGTVTALGENYLSFIDDTMNFDLNEKEANGTDTKWLIAGVSAKIHFNTGNLAGYEFELESYNHETKKIKLIPFEDENGMTFPNADSTAFQIGGDNEYFFIDIRLPQEYIDEAEDKLLTEAEVYYSQNSQPRVQYELNIYDIFLKQFAAPVTIANLFAVGDYIQVEDIDIGVNKSIRITGFARDILKPYKYDITLGEAVTKSTITRLIKEQRSIEEIIKFNNLNDPSRARRNWRSSQEVLSMVFDPEGDYYSDKIKPLSIETTMLQVGAKSMQFVLSDVVFEPNYQGNPNVIKVGGGNLIHYTIEDKIRIWNIATETVSNLQNTPYYIYARCSKTEDNGNIIIDTEQRKVDFEDGYYTFMIGVLNSVETDSDGSNPGRLVSLTYGSSTINGRFIKTGRIESSGGSGSFFDLDNNQFRIGNQNRGLAWNINDDGKLILSGTLVQSQTGETQPIGFFRGTYNNTYTYYNGDLVTYQGSTYRYISDTPAAGNLPTNTTYWTIYAQKGTDGTLLYTWIKYADTETGVGISDNPTGKKYIGFAYNKSTQTESNNPADYTFSLIAGTDGVPGAPGEDGQTLYTWIKYSDYQDGTNMYDIPNDNTEYIGIATNKITSVEGTNKADYTWSKFRGDDGVPGQDGQDGAYFEYRYAKNASTSSPPTLNTTSANPSGWTTSMPSVGALEYLWMTVTKKSADGTLLQNWSTPVRTNGKDGQDGLTGGAGPSLVYRGIFDPDFTYYGNQNRVDAVKYNSLYYVTRSDAGTFQGSAYYPTNPSKWNGFGAQFDSVATNLLLAEMANIADWIIKGGKITSQNNTADGTPRAQLNGTGGSATFASDISIYTESGGTQTEKQTINIDSQSGSIESKLNDDISRFNSQGISANKAGIPAVSASSGLELKASIVGWGFGNLQKTAYSNRAAICGVFGAAQNNNANPAPAFGGYFFNLMAAGLNLSVKTITNSNDGYTPTENDCYFSCYNDKYITFYFRAPSAIGKIYYIRLNNAAEVNLNVTTLGGKQMMMPDGSKGGGHTASSKGELITIIWDGSYWLYNSTVQ